MTLPQEPARSQISDALDALRCIKTSYVLAVLLSDHRTNQQSFWRQLNALTKAYAEATNRDNLPDPVTTDARNEGAATYCLDIVKSCRDGSVSDCMPLI